MDFTLAMFLKTLLSLKYFEMKKQKLSKRRGQLNGSANCKFECLCQLITFEIRASGVTFETTCDPDILESRDDLKVGDIACFKYIRLDPAGVPISPLIYRIRD